MDTEKLKFYLNVTAGTIEGGILCDVSASNKEIIIICSGSHLLFLQHACSGYCPIITANIINDVTSHNPDTSNIIFTVFWKQG